MIEIENLELRQLKLVKMLNSVNSLLNHLNVAMVLHRNSLRRILLSSLPGAAVKYIEIEGVLRIFSSDNVVR